MNKKKAQGGPSWMTIMLVLCVIALLAYMIFSGRIFGSFNDTTSSVEDEIEIGACNVGGIFTPEYDCDADGIRDKCDPCIDGSSTVDSDDDGMPDACETTEGKDDKDTIECKWENTEKDVCSIGPDDEGRDSFTLTAEDCPNNELAYDEISFEKN